MSAPGLILRMSAPERASLEAFGAGPVLVIGRSVDADFCVPGSRFSLFHVLLVWTDGAYRLELHGDKTSDSDAVYVGGRPIDGPVMLGRGDRFRTGGVDFEVVIQGLGVTEDMGTQGPAVGVRPTNNDSMVQFGQGDGRVTRTVAPSDKKDPRAWLIAHWPTVAAGALVLVGGLVFLLTRPPPPPPPAPAVEVDLCDLPYAPTGLDAACSSPDDCAKKAEAAVARAKRKADTGARGYEILADAMAAMKLAEQAGRDVDVSAARAALDQHLTQLTRLCRSVRLDVTQAARAGHRAKAYRACVNLLDAIPDPADPRYVWARKCTIDFAED